MSEASSATVGARPSDPAPGSVLPGAGLAWLQATSRRRWAVSLWLSLAVAITLPALLPLIEVTAAESALADTLARNGSLTVEQSVPDVESFGTFERNVDASVTAQIGADLT